VGPAPAGQVAPLLRSEEEEGHLPKNPWGFVFSYP